MKNRIVFIIIFSWSSLISLGQTLSPREASDLQKIIHNYFYNHEDSKTMLAKERPGGPSEAIIMLLNTDSTGKIAGIHFLIDDMNKDSAYSILRKMRAADFQSWQVQKCQSKTIMIPLFLTGPTNRPGYVMDLLPKYGNFVFKPGEWGDLIVLTGLVFNWPIAIEGLKSGPFYLVNDK